MNIYKNKEKFLALFIIFLFLSSICISTTTATHVEKSNNYITVLEESYNFDEYIIQFKEASILNLRNKIKSQIKNFYVNLENQNFNILVNEKIQAHKNKLLLLHKQAKEDILNLFQEETSSERIFSKDFMLLFNGISIKNIDEMLIQKIKDLPYVKKVYPNKKISITLDESVPLINADDVWKLNDANGRKITGKDITIGILDTGVDYNHPDLKNNFIQEGSYDFINNDTDPMDDHYISHGTHCAGVACGNGNSSGYLYIGVAPEAKFYAFKILDSNGDGNHTTLLAGLTAAADPNGDLDTSDHVDIVSLSFGTREPGRPDDILSQYADAAVDAGIVVVAAAGNNGSAGSRTISSPGCAQKVICVGASNNNDYVASFSSRGPVEWDGNYMTKPDVVAPGVGITTTKKDSGYSSLDGTSMATPHVAGVAALILQNSPDLKENPREVKKIIKETAVDLGYDVNIQGSGRVDALNAINTNQELFINSPSEVFENENFQISLSDKNGDPVYAFIILKTPFHFPRFKFGTTVTFNAPRIHLRSKDTIVSEIIVFKLLNLNEIVKKEIIIVNKN